VARGIAVLLFVHVGDRHFVLAMRAKNLVVFYVLLIHGEDFAAIDASEIQQNVHVYKTPRWIFEWLPVNRMACGLVGHPLVIRLISFS
jgi:hypothetical protein